MVIILIRYGFIFTPLITACLYQSEYRDHRDMSSQIISALISVCCRCSILSIDAFPYVIATDVARHWDGSFAYPFISFVFVWPFLGLFCYS